MSTELLAPIDGEIAKPHTALADFRRYAMSADIDTMKAGLAEYKERRDTFMKWLLDQLETGVHFGVVPGCEPRGGVDPKQWKQRPSLYKAGAAFIADIMGLRPEFAADEAAWKQLGAKEGTFVLVCKLVSKGTGEVVGEGRGAFAVGEKKMGSNSAIKMAEKRALVDAVLNAYAISDLFCQDLEEPDLSTPRHENPQQKPDAPKAQPRGQAVTAEAVKEFAAAWQADHPQGKLSREEWTAQYAEWVHAATFETFDVGKASQWNFGRLSKCKRELENARNPNPNMSQEGIPW